MPEEEINFADEIGLLATFDTAGEVIFAEASTPTHPVFTGLPNVRRVYF
jgi:hypothetical protein